MKIPHERDKYEKKVNLKIIKSIYTIKMIFAFMLKKKQLNLIIYNKEYQNIFGIDFNYYKKVSDRYIIRESDGKGKEFLASKNIMLYEGDYLNGKRNRKGKEYYDDGILKFEGEIEKEKNIMMMVF